MAHVVLFDRLAFQKHKLNPDGSESIEPDGPEEIVYRGHPVPDYVPGWQLNALANAGMIVPVADVPAPVPVPDDLGPQPPAEPVVAGQGTGTSESTAPAPTATRGEWETYAAEIGMDPDEAASYPNKQALIDAINAKQAQA